MGYPADKGTLTTEDYLLAILTAAVRQYSTGINGELRINREELLNAVEQPLRLAKAYDEIRKELILSVGPNFGSQQVFTGKSTWIHERTQAAQLQPSAAEATAEQPSSPLTARSTWSDPQQAEMERRAARFNDPAGKAKEARAQRIREQGAAALEALQQLQAEKTPQE